MNFGNRGQSTLDYAILLLVVLALFVAGGYVKRAIEGRIKETSDQIGPQYDPFLTESSFTTVTHTESVEEVRDWDEEKDSEQLIDPEGERLVRDVSINETYSRAGMETIGIDEGKSLEIMDEEP